MSMFFLPAFQYLLHCKLSIQKFLPTPIYQYVQDPYRKIHQAFGIHFNQLHLLLQYEFYKQLQGAAKGSPVSPVIANIYMEYFESLAIPSSPTLIKWWFRYVDDVHSVTKKDQVNHLQEHLNSIGPHIKFTIELPGTDGLPFLGTLTKPTPNSTESTVYRKPIHRYVLKTTTLTTPFQQNYLLSTLSSIELKIMFYTWIPCKGNGSPSQSPTRQPQPLPNIVLSTKQTPTESKQKAKPIHSKIYRRS